MMSGCAARESCESDGWSAPARAIIYSDGDSALSQTRSSDGVVESGKFYCEYK